MTDMDQTPDSLLTEDIIASLRREKLLSDKQLDALRTKFTSGKIRAEDWQVMIELTIDSETKKNA